MDELLGAYAVDALPEDEAALAREHLFQPVVQASGLVFAADEWSMRKRVERLGGGRKE
jgi:hypothetical protein